MHDDDLCYLLPDSLDVRTLISKFEAQLQVREDPTRTVERTYLDTFDWRLHGDGHLLFGETVSGHLTLQMRDADGAAATFSLPAARTPRFISDLPPGLLKAKLKPLVKMRALLPQAEVRARVRTLCAMDGEQKTVLRIAIEKGDVQSPNGAKPIALPSYVQLLPVKGYPKPLRQIRKLLREELGLLPADQDPWASALATAERRPGSYTSKLEIALRPSMMAGEASRIIFQYLLSTLRINEAGVRNDLDSEFLHDFRVAVRRTRSALGQIKGVLPSRISERYKLGFAWLQSITGPTRDMDVYLLKFDSYRSSLPAAIQKDLDPLHDFLIAHQQREHQRLAKYMASAKYQRLLESWSTFLATPVPRGTSLPNARRPVLDVASERIWRIYRRAVKEGRVIEPHTPAEAVHELRKTCKKLRYLLEFFHSLYDQAELKILIIVLRALQDNLGDFQDFEVQSASLMHFSDQMTEEHKIPHRTLMAMGALVKDLGRRQQQARLAFAECFAKFDRHANRQLFKKLFAPHRVDATQ